MPRRETSVCQRHQGTKHSDPVAREAVHSPRCQPGELGHDSLDKKELKVISSGF